MRKGIEHLLRVADTPDPERAELLWAEYRDGGANADAAFATLLAWYGGAVYRRIWGFVRSDAAEDVFQDVLAALHRHRHKLATFVDALRWLRTVAVTRCVDAHRQATRRKAREQARAVTDEAPAAASLELNEAIRVGLAKLSPREQQAVALVFFEGLTRQDAAAVAGVHRDTFAKTLDAALAKLRTALTLAALGTAATTATLEAALTARPELTTIARLTELAVAAWGRAAAVPRLRTGPWLGRSKLLAGLAVGGLVMASLSLVTWSLLMPVTSKPTARLAVERLEARDNPSGGILDPTFGTDGGVTLPYQPTGRVHTVAEPDGQVVVASASVRKQTVWGPDSQPTVSRLNANGTLDTTFGTNGTVNLPVGQSASTYAVALQPDGKIVIGAVATVKKDDTAYAVARLNTNGTLDTTFGNQSGWWFFNPTSRAESVTKLKVVGSPAAFSIYAGADTRTASGQLQFTAVKLTSTGAPDPTYGTSGFANRPVTYATAPLNDMAVTPTGRVVMATTMPPPGGTDVSTALVAFTSGGQSDTGFDGDGIAYPIPVQGARTIWSHALVAQGESVILAGTVTWGSGLSASGLVYRITQAGAVDSTFATSGVFLGPGMNTTPTTTNPSTQFKGVALAPDGSVVIYGIATSRNVDGTSKGALALGRLSADGQPDATFGPTPDGTGLYLNWSPPLGVTSSMTLSLDPNGNIILAGTFSNPTLGRILRFTGI